MQRVRHNTLDHAAPLLGSVGETTVNAISSKLYLAGSGFTGAAGEEIYGPFEAGFGFDQKAILERLGCADGADGYVDGGIDTATAESVVSFSCGIELPRMEEGEYVSIVDRCGGHTRQYHFHERLICLYDDAQAGHSTKVGEAADASKTPIYGAFEATDTLPALDACGAHFGKTPESPSVKVYHHHVQTNPPFIIGCFGPSDSGEEVTLEECRSYYNTCDGDVEQLTLRNGATVEYDLWCPCFDENGSNDPAAAAMTPAPTPRPTPSPTPRAPTVKPTLRPTAKPSPPPVRAATVAPTLRPSPTPTVEAPTPAPTVEAPTPAPMAQADAALAAEPQKLAALALLCALLALS
ncbi:hypothetical protein M885DRAFT_499103 [Pelagophyceae sp. CCMP2097]|nr:hypothetical protein M885DRAFT_499103 [Pelagophyceae sp. CCMP2097]